MCVLAGRLKLKWSHAGQIHTQSSYLFCVCVDDVVGLGVEPWEGANFISAEGLKIDLSVRESSLLQIFYEYCAQLDVTHPSIHMTWKFVIQGCPTLKSVGAY